LVDEKEHAKEQVQASKMNSSHLQGEAPEQMPS
jgi:hypothetical protein